MMPRPRIPCGRSADGLAVLNARHDIAITDKEPIQTTGSGEHVNLSVIKYRAIEQTSEFRDTHEF